MPVRGEAPDVVRIVEGLRGRVRMRTDITVRFDYGSIVPWVRRVPEGTLAVAGPDALLLASPVELVGENMHTVAEFHVEPGDRVPFVLTWYPSNHDQPAPRRRRGGARGDRGVLGRLDGHVHGRGRAPGRADPVARHAQGADIRADRRDRRGPDHLAAGVPRRRPELGLPVLLGQGRDAHPPLADPRAGTTTRRARGATGSSARSQARPTGRRRCTGSPGSGGSAELELPWLEGYEGSRPVRIGNAACTQFQLDVYGEILDALYQARAAGLPPLDDAWSLCRRLLELLQDVWREPDEGIWEVRGPRRHFTHSKVMAWVAFDRGVRIVEEHGRTGPVERWLALRDEMHAQVCREGFHEGVGAFTQSYGSDRLDASLLLLPLVGFLPVDDPRIAATVAAIERDLTKDGLVERYRADEENTTWTASRPARGRSCPARSGSWR